MERIGIGIIGCGRIADMAYEGYRRIPGVRIAAVCDSDEGIAVRRRAEWGADKHYTDYRRLLDDPAVDAVEILTPQNTHVGISLDAIQAGKHIALQKPMTIDRTGAKRLVDAAASAKTVCKVTENYIFYPPIRFASRIIEEGFIGSPSSISIKLIAGGKGGWPVPPSAWAWRLREFAAGRGMQTFDHGHHLWSTARFLLGPIEKVSAWIGTTSSIIDSPAAIKWKYRDREAFGVCEYVYGQDMEIPSAYYANDEWIQVSGSAGLVTINRCTGTLVEGPSVSLYSGATKRQFDIPSDWKLGFVGSAWNFVRAIRGEEKPHLSFPEAMEILSIDLAIARSAHTGREARLNPDGSILPAPMAWLENKRECRRARNARLALSKPHKAETTEESARSALLLTREFASRLNAPLETRSSARIGLELASTAYPGGIKLFSILLGNATVLIEEDRLPEKPDLEIRVSAEAWEGILSGKQKIETAYLQGRLKLTGSVEKALALKKSFSL
ncbi:MAG TPA: Gfo/Idh/MocA family oxidoreductase [Rectinemataceae bacterium]